MTWSKGLPPCTSGSVLPSLCDGGRVPCGRVRSCRKRRLPPAVAEVIGGDGGGGHWRRRRSLAVAITVVRLPGCPCWAMLMSLAYVSVTLVTSSSCAWGALDGLMTGPGRCVCEAGSPPGSDVIYLGTRSPHPEVLIQPQSRRLLRGCVSSPSREVGFSPAGPSWAPDAAGRHSSGHCSQRVAQASARRLQPPEAPV